MTETDGGSTNWPTAKELRRLGETRGLGTPARIRQILERIAEALEETASEVQSYIREHAEFAEIGRRMLEEWAGGSRHSLRG